MPGYCIHTAHGLRTLELLGQQRGIFLSGKEKRLFLTGLILPDMAKYADGESVRPLAWSLHYASDTGAYFRIPDMEHFFQEHLLSLSEPLYFGYALHLFLDGIYPEFLSEFAAEYHPAKEGENAYFQCLENGERLETKAFWNQIYQEYDILNIHYYRLGRCRLAAYADPGEAAPYLLGKQPAWYAGLYRSLESALSRAAESSCLPEHRMRFLSVQKAEQLVEDAAWRFLAAYGNLL